MGLSASTSQKELFSISLDVNTNRSNLKRRIEDCPSTVAERYLQRYMRDYFRNGLDWDLLMVLAPPSEFMFKSDPGWIADNNGFSSLFVQASFRPAANGNYLIGIPESTYSSPKSLLWLTNPKTTISKNGLAKYGL